MRNIIKTLVLTLISLFCGIFSYRYMLYMDKSNWSILVGILSCMIGMFIALILLVVNLKIREISAYSLIFKDTLTKAYNRRMLVKVFNDYSRDKKPFTLVYLDVDQFKLLNDTNGHTIGDMVLISLVDRIMNTIKKTDKIIRVGGDEFVLVLDGELSDSDIKSVITRIYRSLNTFSLSDMELDISVSIGYSSYPKDSEDLSKLIDIADEQMYRVKRSA